MKKIAMAALVLALASLTVTAQFGSPSPVSAQSARVNQPGPAVQLEEIYIGRSVRESRVAPTAFCAQARTGFSDAASEDRYTFRSTTSRSSDGRIVAANRNTIGNIHACFGPTSDPAVVNFYGEGILGRVTFKGSGECSSKADWPEKGLAVSRCFLELSGLPDRYVGGLLTTNTVNSLQLLGMESDPRGYTQASIATIRLWKKRRAVQFTLDAAPDLLTNEFFGHDLGTFSIRLPE